MARRAIWKGELKIASLGVEVALYTAASTSERVSFHLLNRKSGNRLHREYVDTGTGKPVEAKDQVKGYETTKGQYVVLEPDEVAAALPASDKTIAVAAFVSCGEIDDTFFERPYYVTPANETARESYAALRDAMEKDKLAAIAHALLFRRVRTLLIRAHGAGIIATTLHFEDEIRPAATAFADLKPQKIDDEMLSLARHIIKTKAGHFKPEDFDDRYEAAVTELIRAKLAGRKLRALPKPKATPRNDLLEALRQSANGKAAPSHKTEAAAKPRRRAG